MMKKIFLLSLLVAVAVPSAGQSLWYEFADSVSSGKELSRGDVICYASRDEAVARPYHRSEYLVPITEWKSSTVTGATVFSTTYKLPFKWVGRRMIFHIGGCSASYDVWANGRRIAISQTASTPSEFDLTPYSVEGNNTLEVRVYSHTAAQVLESTRAERAPSITGETYIVSQPAVRVRDIAVDTRMQGTEGVLYLGVILKSHLLNTKEYKIYYELLSPRGEVVAADNRVVDISMRAEDTVAFFRRIPDIMPWSHEEPCLYTLVVKTQYEGRFKEYVSFRIGFRSIDYNDGLLSLNGIPLRLQIADYAPPQDMKLVADDVAKLRNDGYTMLRIKGAPQSRAFYELCDSIGMYVCAQADIDTRGSGMSLKVGGNPSNDPRRLSAYIDRTASMYHASKNYPSVIMFSLADSSANGYNLYESYLMLKRLERQRPVVYASTREWNNDSLNLRRMSNLRRTNLDWWVAIYAVNQNLGQFSIANTRHYTPILGQLRYVVKVGNKTVSQGEQQLRVLPKSDVKVQIPLGAIKPGKPFDIELEVVRDKPLNCYVRGNESLPAEKVRLAYKKFTGFIQ